MQNLRNFFSNLRNHLPLLLVIVVALAVALTNIDFSAYYSGWDNIHAEFNLSRYFNQVFFGAWSEHQGLGAPSSQAQLSEITRLPILFVLKLLLPDHLVRWVFIFGMYLVGGIGAYLYLSRIWLGQKSGQFKDWIAGLGAIFYLLNLLTLQQFYISFEMFMVQFALLPFLFFSLHRLNQDWSVKNLLYFILIQLLIAPSGHTPTVFYLGVIFSLIYAFFLALKKGFFKAVFFSFLIGLLTFASNAYWIVPNVYYSLHNAHYVQESRDNALFATESLWSVREAGTLPNFLHNTHYLFNWKDYSFADNQFEFIFNEWLPHLNLPLTEMLLTMVGTITVFGIVITVFRKDKGHKRWAVIAFYLMAASLIWIDIFPTRPIIDWLYQFGPFREAFRNPFTKLSILYSFTLLLFLASFLEWAVQYLRRKTAFFFTGKAPVKVLLAFSFAVLIYISLPAFRGHFISERLSVKYPDQYWELFDYMKTRDKDLRVLQLPQFGHAAWSYHDWAFIEPGNGYQGMDFTFFGLPQAMMNRDSDRWVETSDFFYYQLKYALDRQDPQQFRNVLDKYNIDLVLIDETKISTSRRDYSYQRDHELVKTAGLELVWSKDFLYVYEKPGENLSSSLYIPKKVSYVEATHIGRLHRDFIYRDLGDYVLVDNQQAALVYPFMDLMTPQLHEVDFENNYVYLTRDFSLGDYQLSLPGKRQVYYQTPVMLQYHNRQVKVIFPKNQVIASNQTITLPQLSDFSFELNEEHNFESIIVFFNDQGFILEPGATAYPLLTAEIGQPVVVSYAAKPEELSFTQELKLSRQGLDIFEALTLEPDWSLWRQDLNIVLRDTDRLSLRTKFPILELDLLQNPSENCGQPKRGEIEREVSGGDIVYRADDYAVNCNGYNFDFVSSSYPSVLRIMGKGSRGRATKFFVHYTTRDIVLEDFIMPEDEFDVYLNLHPVTNDPRSQFILNWETRSFGQLSENILNKIELAPLPLNEMAQITLTDLAGFEPTVNQVEIELERSPFNFIHLVKYSCPQENCYIGLDQTYDDLWLGLHIEQRRLVPHLRLNNWANLWQVSDEGHLLIWYLPEFVSLACIGVLGLGVMVLLIKKSKIS
jgi:hypothetical protein